MQTDQTFDNLHQTVETDGLDFYSQFFQCEQILSALILTQPVKGHGRICCFFVTSQYFKLP